EEYYSAYEAEADDAEEADEYAVEYTQIEMRQLGEWGTCTLVYGEEAAEEEEQDEDNYENEDAEETIAAVYVGFHCSENGGIRLGLFSDQFCTTFDNSGLTLESMIGVVTPTEDEYAFLSESEKISCDDDAQEYAYELMWDSAAEMEEQEVDEYGNVENAEITEFCASMFTGLTCWANVADECKPVDQQEYDEDGEANEDSTAGQQTSICNFVEHAANGNMPEFDTWHYTTADQFSSSSGSAPSAGQKAALAVFVPLTVIFGATAFYYHGKLTSAGKGGPGLASYGGAMA
ncbi:hypothetical protein TeGR_g8392, partial [Tetraparma gracilis]